MPQPLSALRSKNLRLYFLGHGISLVGTWITTIASAWLVYRLEQSEAQLGLVIFCSQFPIALFAPFAGVYIDRWDKRRVIICTQILSMLQSFGLAYLALSGSITVWQIMLLNVFQGVVNAFDNPARPALLSEIVHERSDLPNAIALNSALFHAARLAGPAIGGILVASFGEGLCFLLDGFSYLAVILSLSLLVITRPNIKAEPTHRWYRSLYEGLRYALTHKRLRDVMMLVAAISFFSTPHTTLLPVFAREVFHSDSQLYGYFAGASGLGAFLGAVFLAMRSESLSLDRVVRFAPFIQATGLILLGLSGIVSLTISSLILIGIGQVIVVAGASSIIQTTVEDSKRGRISSLLTTIFMGLVPICGLIAGATAERIGVDHTALVSGIFTLVIAFVGIKPKTSYLGKH